MPYRNDTNQFWNGQRQCRTLDFYLFLIYNFYKSRILVILGGIIMKTRGYFAIVMAILMLVLAFSLVACKKESLTVKFDTQAEGTIDDIVVTEGDTISEPQTPYKKAHTFLGWYNGDTKWDFSSKVKENITLVAKWELTNYSITYEVSTQNDKNKPSFTINDLPLRLNEAQSVNGSYFVGWELNGKRVTRLVSLENVTLTAIYKSAPTELAYEEHDDYVVVTGLAEETNDIIIPATYNSKPVTKIANGAFAKNDDIYSLTILGSVTEIGAEAFKGCENLQRVVIADKIKVIGDSAFMDCSGFYEIVIPNGAEYIGAKAFKGCTLLEDINLPDSVNYLGEDFILDCPSIKYDLFTNGEGQDLYIDNWLIKYGDTNARTAVFKEGTVGIASYAFYKMSNLRTINTTPGLKYIGSHAFFYCYNVKVLNFTSDVKYIGMYAFYNLRKLEAVTIPDSVETIGMKAFGACYSLTQITCEATEEKPGYGQEWHGGREVVFANGEN